MLQTMLETQRLAMRALTRDDVPALTAILSDPAVMSYSLRGVCDEAATRDFIAWCRDCYATHGLGPWALIDKRDASLIGFCGVAPEAVGAIEQMSLGYRLATRYWNKGLAAEAATAVLAHAFEVQGVASIVAIIEPSHHASLRVAEKVGFARFEMMTFHGRPVRLYRLDRLAWTDSRSALRNHADMPITHP